MPGQFQQFVFKSFFSLSSLSMIYLYTLRLQTDYAHEFTVFKPDKKQKWLPHLGAVQLELKLEDRVVDVDVFPLEADFIELFSRKGLFSYPASFFPPIPNFERLVFFLSSSCLDSGISHILCWFNRPWGCYQGFIYLGGSWGVEGRP